MTPTLMLSPQFGEDSNRLQAAARGRDWRVVRWSNWQRPVGLETSDACLYSSPLFAARVAQLTGLSFPEPPDDWLANLPLDLVQRKIESTSLGLARECTKRAFYKPAAFKTFKAAVYESGAELPTESDADGTTPVLISEIVHWESEFRFFLLDGQVITGSVYFRNGQSAQVGDDWPASEDEFEQAALVARRAFQALPQSLHRSIVIDTGFIRGAGWAVIEANPSWGSGLYGSDANLVLDVIQAAVVR